MFVGIKDIFECFVRQNHFILASQLGVLLLPQTYQMSGVSVTCLVKIVENIG